MNFFFGSKQQELFFYFFALFTYCRSHRLDHHWFIDLSSSSFDHSINNRLNIHIFRLKKNEQWPFIIILTSFINDIYRLMIWSVLPLSLSGIDPLIHPKTEKKVQSTLTSKRCFFLVVKIFDHWSLCIGRFNQYILDHHHLDIIYQTSFSIFTRWIYFPIHTDLKWGLKNQRKEKNSLTTLALLRMNIFQPFFMPNG